MAIKMKNLALPRSVLIRFYSVIGIKRGKENNYHWSSALITHRRPFLLQIGMEDEPKQQSMEWRHMTFPRNKNSRVCHWQENSWLQYFMRTLIFSWTSCLGKINETLQSLNPHFLQVCLTGKNQCYYFMKMPGHTYLNTTETIATCGCTVLLNPSYSPYLAPLHCHLFGPLKERLWGHHYMKTRHCNTPWARCCTRRTQLVMGVNICSC